MYYVTFSTGKSISDTELNASGTESEPVKEPSSVTYVLKFVWDLFLHIGSSRPSILTFRTFITYSYILDGTLQ